MLRIAPVNRLERLRMLMPLLVRLTDSEVEAVDGVVPQVSDGINYGRSVLEEVRAARLPIDQEALFPDLHVDPVYGNIQPGGQFWDAEQVGVMGPPVARLAVTLMPAPRRIWLTVIGRTMFSQLGER